MEDKVKGVEIINITEKSKIFTSRGLVGPGVVIALTEKEALKYIKAGKARRVAEYAESQQTPDR